MHPMSRRLSRAVGLVLLAAWLATGSVAAVSPQLPRPEDGLPVALEAMHQLATDRREVKRASKTTKPKPGLPIKLGKDGRLTVLLLGSDWRAESGGERLDVVMVASIDPTSGKAAVVSIPRDMTAIPFAGGGNSGGLRVNSIYFIRYRDPKLGHAGIDRKALKRFSKDIGAFLGTEIDYWALTRFATFGAVVNSLDGIRLDIDESVLDTSYHSGRTHGIWFPAQKDYSLKGNTKCRPKPKKCHSALVYARSRHGFMGDGLNNDYRRAERQQQIVAAGVQKVLSQVGSGIGLLGLLLLERKHIETDLPTTAEAAAQAFAMLSKLNLPPGNMKVFAPSTWAYTGSDGLVKPNTKAIRRWVKQHFYKVGPGRT